MSRDFIDYLRTQHVQIALRDFAGADAAGLLPPGWVHHGMFLNTAHAGMRGAIATTVLSCALAQREDEVTALRTRVAELEAADPSRSDPAGRA